MTTPSRFKPRKTTTKLALLLLALVVAGCSTTTYNPTVYPYKINQQALRAQPIKTILIASENVSGAPTKSILREPSRRIDRELIKYLRSNGYRIAPQHIFDNAWKQAIYRYGNIYDPTSGKVDRAAWNAVMATTLAAVRERGGIDGILFTDVIEHDVQHSAGLQHYARWYGVTRKPATQGAGSGVPVGFNWTQTIKGASLRVTLYNMQGDPVFASFGGLDTLHAVDMRNPDAGFVRRKKLLKSDSVIEEGIQLALHPLVPMKKYPGNKK